MDLDELLTMFAKNNGVEKPTQKDGRFLIEMEGVDVLCSEVSGKLLVEADIAPVAKADGQRGDDNRRLLEKSLGLIRDQRGCITLDEETGYYRLYQRTPMDQISTEMFQELIEAFGGCCLYYKGLFGKGASGPAMPGGMMMP